MLKAETREERGISSHLGMMWLKILNGERNICIEFCKSVENRKEPLEERWGGYPSCTEESGSATIGEMTLKIFCYNKEQRNAVKALGRKET